MRQLDVTEIETIVGRPIAAVLMKEIDTLDEGCPRVLARSLSGPQIDKNNGLNEVKWP